MSDERNPWESISKPASGIHVRKLDSHKNGDIFWAKNSDNTRMLIISLDGDQRDIYNECNIQIKGLSTDLRFYDETGRQGLVLFLESALDSDIFYDFCGALAGIIKLATNSNGVVFATFQHIKRWKNFLSGGGQHLSPQQIRGLIGELLFLQQILQAGQALDAWAGPDGGNQDFILGDAAIEIKALFGLERGRVRISSEDQLETIQSKLFLKIFRLVEADKNEAAFSLNSLVSEIRSQLPTAYDQEIFDIKLAAVSYAPLPFYNSPNFRSPEQFMFLVTDEFPRLIRSGLPAGISSVLYDVSLESIKPFLCKDEFIRKE